jgi:hypothetical protein
VECIRENDSAVIDEYGDDDDYDLDDHPRNLPNESNLLVDVEGTNFPPFMIGCAYCIMPKDSAFTLRLMS